MIETVHFRPFSLSFAVFFFARRVKYGLFHAFSRLSRRSIPSTMYQIFMCGGAGTKLACSSLPLPSPSYLKLHFYATSLDWFPETPLSLLPCNPTFKASARPPSLQFCPCEQCTFCRPGVNCGTDHRVIRANHSIPLSLCLSDSISEERKKCLIYLIKTERIHLVILAIN